jgi:ribose 5-phosphate isomerase A
MAWREAAKKRAAARAVELIKDGSVIGLGAGSTVAFAVNELGRRMREENLRVQVVPSSNQTQKIAVECGVPITTLDKHPSLELDIDGADQIDADLNLIKGMGGALTREKIVAQSSKALIIVGDETKLTDALGRNQPLPVEVLPFALPLVASKIRALGGKPVLKMSRDGSGPFVTDNGNSIFNVDFGIIKNPTKLDHQLKNISGVIETGLFLGMAETAYVGTETGVKVLRKKVVNR